MQVETTTIVVEVSSKPSAASEVKVTIKEGGLHMPCTTTHIKGKGDQTLCLHDRGLEFRGEQADNYN